MASLKDLTKRIKDYFNPQSNAGQNFWSTSTARGLARVQQAGPKEYFLPTSKFGSTQLSNFPKFEFSNKIQTPIPRFSASVAESIINQPSEIARGIGRLGTDIRLNRVTPQRTIANLAPIGELALLVGTGGGVKVATGVGKQTFKHVSKQTAKQAFIQGAKKAAPYGASYGLLEGLRSNPEARNVFEQSLKSLPQAIAGGITAGLFGGTIGTTVNAYKNNLTKSVAQQVYLRNPKGQFTKPQQFTKAQKVFQEKVNKGLGRNPNQPVYPQDLQEFIRREGEKRGGLTVRDVNKDINQKAQIPQKGQGLNLVQGQTTLRSPKIKFPLKGEQLVGDRLSGGSKIPPSSGSIPQSDDDLVKILSKTLKEAKPLRGAQEELYTKARSQKLAKLMAAREKLAGEKGFYQELGALKGELPKVEYESIRQNFNQPSVNRLYNMIKENKILDEWDKVNAQVGLQKILGEKGGGVPTKGEIEKLHTVFGRDFTEALLSKRSTFEKLTELGMQLYNLPRSTMAGVGDLSATLMQNMLFAYRHPFITAQNLGREVKMFASEKAYKASGEEIASRPTWEVMKKAKVDFTDVGPIVRGREEQFMTPLLEKIPGVRTLVRMTSRAWTGFLNRMRADVFDHVYYSAKAAGKDLNDPRF